MNKAAGAASRKTAAEYRAEVDDLIRQVDRMLQGMAQNRSEVEPHMPQSELMPSQKEELRMDESITTPAPKTAAEYEAAVDALLAEMARMNARSEQTWAEIERLKAESAAIQAEKQILNASIDHRLKALTRRVEEEVKTYP